MRAALLLALLLTSPAARARAAPGPGETLGLRAAGLARQGRWREAADLYRRVARLLPGPGALRDLMWALWRAGDREGTIEAASSLLRRSGRDLEALDLLAMAQYSAGRWREALESYLRVESLSPGRDEVRGTLASLFERLKDYPSALGYCDLLLAERPDDARLRAQRARLLLLQDRPRESIEEWERALRLSPEETAYRVPLAKALYMAGRKEDARRELERLLSVQPRNGPALELLTGMSAAAGDLGAAYQAWARALSEPVPGDEPRLLGLAGLYSSKGLLDEAVAVLERARRLDPLNGEVLIARGEALESRGRRREAARDFEEVTRLNADSSLAWYQLANCLGEIGENERALEAVARAREIHPTSPVFLGAQARFLFETGREEEGSSLLEGWLGSNPERTLPVLLYHGLAPKGDDPMLVSEVNITALTFRRQMESLRDAGYSAVTAAQAADWLHGRGGLPDKAVLITFDDARLDSFVNADPVLAELGLKATMFVPLVNVDRDLPGFASWEQLGDYRDTGRWDLQAHGDQSHTMVRTDAEGRTGRFLTNRRWLEEAGRLETEREWRERVRADYAAVKRKMAQRLGTAPVAYAYPGGDYGESASQNAVGAVAVNLEACRESYELCMEQDSRGINVRTVDHARVTRFEPRDDWDGERLLKHLREQSPFVQARRALIHRIGWSPRPSRALPLLEANARAGVSEPVQLADEARIRAGAGDALGALLLARRALEQEPNDQNKSLVESLARQAGPEWSPSQAFFRDNDGRETLLFRQSLGPFPVRSGSLSLSHLRSTYRQAGLPSVAANGGGLELRRGLGLGQEAALRWEGRALGGGAGLSHAVLGTLRSRWGEGLRVELALGQQPLETAGALLDGVRERLASLSGAWGPEESWQASARLRLADLSDGNGRATASATISRPLGPKGLRVLCQSTLDAGRGTSPRYYNPRRLRMQQAGLGYSARPRPWLSLALKYLPGFAVESGGPGRLSQDLELGLAARWERLSLEPSFSLSRGPVYRSAAFGAALGWRL